ncbi:hypothetical protein P7K49_033935, partial [Saguinus oedipus]
MSHPTFIKKTGLAVSKLDLVTFLEGRKELRTVKSEETVAAQPDGVLLCHPLAGGMLPDLHTRGTVSGVSTTRGLRGGP